MSKCGNEVELNGEVYVKKEELNDDDYCIVRTYSAGVFAGYVVKRDGKEVEMKDARRLWYWDGAASLSQLAMEGTNNPSNCKFPCEVAKVFLTEAIEILPCTLSAIKSIKGVKVWKQ